MQIFNTLMLIFCSISMCQAAASIQFYKDSAHPGKCVLRGLILSPGVVYNTPKQCEQITCFENSKASIYSCGIYTPPAGCIVVPTDPNKFYPDCCNTKTICNNVLTEEGELAPIIL